MSYQQERELGPGSLPNEYVRYCKICDENGFPHEAIRRLTTYGGRETKLVNYFDGTPHYHKFSRTQWNWDHYQV